MRHLGKFVVKFLKEEDGPTVVEYAVMLALIILVCFAAIGTIGTTTQSNFHTINLSQALQSS